MSQKKCRIGVVATGSRADADMQARTQALAARLYGEAVEIVFHPNSFLTAGHFGGDDAARAAAFLEVANDPTFDALWFARGGYGSNRIAEAAAKDLPEAAKAKTYLGYSDGGFLLAALHKAGLRVAHGPMVQDVARHGGEAAVRRALAWLATGDGEALEPGLDGPAMAFNLVVLSSLMGTPLEPDFSGAELLIEEVDEELYRIDRFLFHVSAQPGFTAVRQLRLGRCLIRDNDRPFGSELEAVVRYWCERAGVRYAGRADIGHDSLNRIVPFPSRNACLSLS